MWVLRLFSLWRHQMETFSALLTLCARNSPITAEFPVQRPVTRSFDVFFDLCLNKRLSKQSWGLWSETPPRPLWRHCYLIITNGQKHTVYQSTRHMYSSESCNLTQGLLVSQWYFCKRRNKVMHSYQTWKDDMMNSVSNIAASRVFKTGTFRKHTLSGSNHGSIITSHNLLWGLALWHLGYVN